MRTINKQFFIGVTLLLALLGNVQAEDSLSAFMQRLKVHPVSKVAYQETRQVKLLTEPWHGSGYLYALPPDLMLREQLKPERLLMGVKGNQTFYFDIKNDQRHQGELDGENELSMPLAVFKAITNADEALLRRWYHIAFASDAKAWSMNLKPKQPSETLATVVVSGLPDQAANKVVITQKNGDVSEFSLQPTTAASTDQGSINKLFKELQGE